MRRSILTLFAVLTLFSCNKKAEEPNPLVPIEISYVVPTTDISVPEFIFPVIDDHGISSGYGYRDVVVKGIGGEEGDFHRGIDVVASEDSKIVAASSGIVYIHYPPPSKWYKGHPVFGGFIVIKHTDFVFSLYGHMDKTYVKVGQFVQRGDVIGELGNTGISTGPHLHFEILLNPANFVE